MLLLINAHMCAREPSRHTPDSSRPLTLRHLVIVCVVSLHIVRLDIHVAAQHIAFEWPIRTRHHQRALTCSHYVVWDRAQ